MNPRRLVLAATTLALLVAGCGKTITLRGPITPSMAEEVTRAASGKPVEVTLSADSASPGENGPPGPDKRKGRGLATNNGSFSFREDVYQQPNYAVPDDANREPAALITVPFNQARAIEIKDRKKGAAMGAVVGVIPGFLLGVMAGLMTSNERCSSTNFGPWTCESDAPSSTVTIGVAVASVALGALIGAARGDRTTYVFRDR